MKIKTKGIRLPPVGRRARLPVRTKLSKYLAQSGSVGVKQFHVLSAFSFGRF
jgi:hypothetical protein